jgi:hypothetical protein
MSEVDWFIWNETSVGAREAFWDGLSLTEPSTTYDYLISRWVSKVSGGVSKDSERGLASSSLPWLCQYIAI